MNSGTRRNGAEQCTTDTYGMAGEGWDRPYVHLEELHKQCKFKYENAHETGHDSLVVNFYAGLEEYKNYDGVDMVYERHAEYPANEWQHLPEWSPGCPNSKCPKTQRQRILFGDCEITDDSGGAYHIQRIGPFNSTGNYDYWQLGWSDVFGLSRILSAHPEGVMFDMGFYGPVASTGEILGHPPMHIHHIHVLPQPGVKTKMMQWEYRPSLLMEQHGDYECTPGDGGFGCLFEKTAVGTVKHVTGLIDIEGELNDVRAPGSEPLEWWFQVAIHWFPKKRSLIPLSSWFMIGPGRFDITNQFSQLRVFPAPTHEPSVYWYSGRMQRSGVMVRNKLHTHNTLFHKAFWFRATPKDLGMDDDTWQPGEFGDEPITLSVLGFANHVEVLEHLLSHLERAGKIWDATCNPNLTQCMERRPAIICQCWVSNEEFQDPRSGLSFAYDRRAPCCCREWAFSGEDTFTTISFLVPLKTAPGPWSPHYTPPFVNGHLHWILSFDAQDGISHYDFQANHMERPTLKARYVNRRPFNYSVYRYARARREAKSNGSSNPLGRTVKSKVFIAEIYNMQQSQWLVWWLVALVLSAMACFRGYWFRQKKRSEKCDVDV